MEWEELLALLVCPKCRGELEALDHKGLLCKSCKVVYPIRDEIPVLLPAEAIPFSVWEKCGDSRENADGGKA